MSHTIYAAKFQQTIIHQHVHLRREIQSHASAHVLMRLYRIDKSLICLQGRHVRIGIKQQTLTHFPVVDYTHNYYIIDKKMIYLFIQSLKNGSKTQATDNIYFNVFRYHDFQLLFLY